MLAALAPEKGRGPRSGKDRWHLIPVFMLFLLLLKQFPGDVQSTEFIQKG